MPREFNDIVENRTLLLQHGLRGNRLLLKFSPIFLICPANRETNPADSRFVQSRAVLFSYTDASTSTERRMSCKLPITITVAAVPAKARAVIAVARKLYPITTVHADRNASAARNAVALKIDLARAAGPVDTRAGRFLLD